MPNQTDVTRQMVDSSPIGEGRSFQSVCLWERVPRLINVPKPQSWAVDLIAQLFVCPPPSRRRRREPPTARGTRGPEIWKEVAAGRKRRGNDAPGAARTVTIRLPTVATRRRRDLARRRRRRSMPNCSWGSESGRAQPHHLPAFGSVAGLLVVLDLAFLSYGTLRCEEHARACYDHSGQQIHEGCFSHFQLP